MSDKEEIIPKEEKTEIEKGNMKITLIPKVIIKGSSAKNELKEETKCIKKPWKLTLNSNLILKIMKNLTI